MEDSNRFNGEILYGEGRESGRNCSWRNLWSARITFLGWHECVWETANESRNHSFFCVEGDAAAACPVKRSNIIKPCNVIAVLMGNNNCIELCESIG